MQPSTLQHPPTSDYAAATTWRRIASRAARPRWSLEASIEKLQRYRPATFSQAIMQALTTGLAKYLDAAILALIAEHFLKHRAS